MTFEHPIWLYSIPIAILLLVGVFAFWQISSKKRLSNFASHALLPALLESYSKIRTRLKYILIALGIIGLLITLAQPQSGYTWEERPRNGIDVIFAVDASRSMLAEDIKPNRLERSKFAVLDLLKKLNGNRVGLVAFAGDAFLQCPLTFDYDAFRQSLETINTRIIFKGGSDLGGAIRESTQSFRKGKNKEILVVFTDGEDLGTSSLDAAQEAADQEIIIYTVGVGTPEGELIPLRAPHGGVDYVRDDKNRLVKSKLDESTLSSVAELTNGFYARLGNSNWNLENLYNAGIDATEEEELERQKVPLERFQWPLACALLLLVLEPLIGTRKRSLKKNPTRALIPAIILVCLFLSNTSTLKADDTALYNEGTRLYNEGHYQEASQKLTTALETGNLSLQEHTFYNLGNAHYREGQVQRATNPQEAKQLWESALNNYKNTLELDPGNKNAAHNQKVVEDALEQLNKELEEQQQQDSQDDSKNSEKSEEENQQNEENKNDQEKNNSDKQDSEPSSNDKDNENEGGDSDKQNEDSKSQESEDTKDDNNSNKDDSSPDSPGSEEEDKKEDKPQDSPQADDEKTPNETSEQKSPASAEKDKHQDGKQGEKQEELSLDPDKNPINSPQETTDANEPAEMQWEAIRKEEAARLLDSLKQEERKLPFTGAQDGLSSDGPSQDW